MPRSLILLPTYDHQDTLYTAIGSVLGQTVDDWRLVIILDGAPPRSHAIAGAFASLDRRIEVVARPKGARLGEAYRDRIIREHPAEFVFHIGDDDLWLPNHLAILGRMLETADLVHSACLRVDPGAPPWERASSVIGVLTSAAARTAIRERRGNVASPTQLAYRREAYLRLPEGWTTTPSEWTATDIYMLAKFLVHPGLRVAATTRPTTVLAYAAPRSAWSVEHRAAELHAYAALLSRPQPELDLARAVAFERAFAGWCLDWLRPGPEAELDEVLQLAGVTPVVVDRIEMDALNALAPGRATVAAGAYACESPADWLLTHAQRAELDALLTAWRRERAAR